MRPPLLPLTGLRVVLAEDQPTTRDLFAAALAQLGAHVVTVRDGSQAISACLSAEDAKQPFHVALLDYRMPVCDGAEAAFALRASRYSGEVVGLTAGIDPGEAKRWRENGCAFVLPKCLGPREVARRLAAYVVPPATGDAAVG